MKKLFFTKVNRPKNVVMFEWACFPEIIYLITQGFHNLTTNSVYAINTNSSSWVINIYFFMAIFSALIMILLTIYRIRIIYVAICIASILVFGYQIYGALYFREALELKYWNIDILPNLSDGFFFILNIIAYYFFISKSFRVWVFRGENTD